MDWPLYREHRARNANEFFKALNREERRRAFTILSDVDIKREGFIKRAARGKKRKGVISYGYSSFGYDIRVSRHFRIFTNINSSIIDPKRITEHCFTDVRGSVCVIPPNSYALGESVERFEMPENLIGICLGKSTYARAGIAVNCTPIEPSFKGTIVVEIINATPLPAKIYAMEGIAQIVFFRGPTPSRSYASKGGKYQNQKGIVLPRLDK
jgi:dCTP deaminase